MVSYWEAIADFVTTTLFGERMPGESLKPVRFKTTHPTEPLSYNEWMQMFRVSSLHGVNQRIFFESRS